MLYIHRLRYRRRKFHCLLCLEGRSHHDDHFPGTNPGPEIRINAVCPGFIQGDWLRQGMGDEAYELIKGYLESTVPLQMTATAEQVADAIVYFICGAQLVTGETLLLDGGYHLGMAPLTRR